MLNNTLLWSYCLHKRKSFSLQNNSKIKNFLFVVMAAISNEGLCWWTQFWKRTTKDRPINIWFNSAKWFQRRKSSNNFFVRISWICIFSSKISKMHNVSVKPVSFIILLSLKRNYCPNFSSFRWKMWFYWVCMCVFPYVLFKASVAMLYDWQEHWTQFCNKTP